MHFWEYPKDILVILAHPDDPEFFCGATIAEWAQQGNKVSYCLLTKGDKGVNDHFDGNVDIRSLRISEQRVAASILGVGEIDYLNYEDGYLQPTMELRKEVTRIIRKKKPQIVVTCDPTHYFFRNDYINHPDHRAAGQVVLDAVFPASQNPLYFSDLLADERLQPHHVEEVWLSLPKEPNLILDVTATWEQKMRALLEHRSQIGEEAAFRERMLKRRTDDSSDENPRYEETFFRIIFRK